MFPSDGTPTELQCFGELFSAKVWLSELEFQFLFWIYQLEELVLGMTLL